MGIESENLDFHMKRNKKLARLCDFIHEVVVLPLKCAKRIEEEDELWQFKAALAADSLICRSRSIQLKEEKKVSNQISSWLRRLFKTNFWKPSSKSSSTHIEIVFSPLDTATHSHPIAKQSQYFGISSYPWRGWFSLCDEQHHLEGWFFDMHHW